MGRLAGGGTYPPAGLLPLALLTLGVGDAAATEPIFTRMAYSQRGPCAEIGRVYEAQITVEGGLLHLDYLLEAAVLEEGVRGQDECIEEPIAGVDCATVKPLPTRLLDSDEVWMVSQVFSTVARDLTTEPDPDCAVVDPCVVHSFEWQGRDGATFSDSPCSTSRATARQVARLLDVIERLRHPDLFYSHDLLLVGEITGVERETVRIGGADYHVVRVAVSRLWIGPILPEVLMVTTDPERYAVGQEILLGARPRGEGYWFPSTSRPLDETEVAGFGPPCAQGEELAAREGEICPAPVRPGDFRRGDVDLNGALDITDPIITLLFQFISGPLPPCRDAADFDDNGVEDISDPILMLEHLFLGTFTPPEPYRECGVDPTPDHLDCRDFPACRD